MEAVAAGLERIAQATDAASRDEVTAAIRLLVPEMRDPDTDLPAPEPEVRPGGPRPSDTVH